jgi:hypothetical protein
MTCQCLLPGIFCRSLLWFGCLNLPSVSRLMDWREGSRGMHRVRLNPVQPLLSFCILLVVVGVTRHLSSLVVVLQSWLVLASAMLQGTRICKQLVGQYISASSPGCGFHAFFHYRCCRY